MSYTKDLFDKEIYVWRGYASLFWFCVVCFFISIPLVFAGSISFEDWSISIDFSWRIIVSFGLVLLVIAFCLPLCKYEMRYYTVYTDGSFMATTMFRPWQVIQCILYIIWKGVVFAGATWCVASILHPPWILPVAPCGDNSGPLCLNSAVVFMLIHGLFLGLVSAICFFTHKDNLMTFPLIQVFKMERFRSSVVPLVWQSCWFVGHRLVYFTILYHCLIGNLIIPHLCQVLDITYNDSTQSIWNTLNASVLGEALLVGTLLQFLSRIFSTLLTICQTDALQFAVNSEIEAPHGQLSEAMCCDTSPMLQFLGYQWLALLTMQSAKARAQLFSLSRIGGHPHTWVQIMGECMACLHALLNHVQEFNNKIFASGAMRQMRHTSGSGDDNNTNIDSKVRDIPNPLNRRKPTGIKKIWWNFLSIFGIKSMSSTEMSLSEVMRKTLMYQWAIQSAANLTAASFKEDSYGIVLKDLQDIVTVFVVLHEECEKMFKTVCGVQRGVRLGDVEWAQHNTLRITLKSSIYQLTNTFGKTLLQVQLKPDVQRRLQMFLDHRV